MATYDHRFLGTTALQTPKVLLVNADPNKLSRMSAIVRAEGCTPIEATTYIDAKRQFDAQLPQAMIVDIRLGEFNGLQLLIRARAVRSNIPVIVTSDIPDAVLEREARSFGAHFVVGAADPKQVLSWITAETWSAPIAREHWSPADPTRLSV